MLRHALIIKNLIDFNKPLVLLQDKKISINVAEGNVRHGGTTLLFQVKLVFLNRHEISIKVVTGSYRFSKDNVYSDTNTYRSMLCKKLIVTQRPIVRRQEGGSENN